MTAETEPLSASELRSLVIQLRSFTDQGEFTPEDESLLGQVLTDDQLDAIEEHHGRLYTALTRIEEDYAKVVEASGHLEASQDAADALVIIAALESGTNPEDDDSTYEEETEEPDDGDGEGHAAPDDDERLVDGPSAPDDAGDPDADL